MRVMHVLGVRVSVPGNEVVVILADPAGSLVLPIVIGPREGAAIASAQAGVVPPRPQTHDLFVDVLGQVGANLDEVRVTDVRSGTFHAVLVLAGGTLVDARPSDAIALALRAHCPVLCEESVLERAGVPLVDSAWVGEEGEDVDEEDPAEVLQEFREFLKGVDPEDFDDARP
ncbi:bifunctional nuclease family protein [Georgenia sp. 10Sc9-8]|uniref:Bifunctional nuclease family protein n=1 Tax=Georgenia halotolerans TaxID=3028317 RepID=A0ABT5U1S1_9MICO|nr:bifunctional nuclease family protein [Georgenia halotolerans]